MNISASSYARFNTCQRLYYYENVLRLVRVRQDGARAFGTMYHAGLEAWWRAMDGGDTPWREADAALVAAFKAVHDSGRHINTDPFEIARAETMLLAYHERHFELDFETITDGGGVEESFDVPLLDPDGKAIKGWRVIGKRDAFKRFTKIGRSRVVEHKQTSSEIHGASDYWLRLKLAMQPSIYIDAAQQLGFHEVNEALYDVSRRPDIRPLRKTPDEKRRMTKGKGCPHCGGRKGGKLGSAKGTGRIMITTPVDGDGRRLSKPVDVEVDCTSCKGSGWHEAPRLPANQRDADESIEDFKARLANELIEDPDAYFRMGVITRSPEQIAEARANLVVTTGLIGSLITYAQSIASDPCDLAARRCFAQNDGACTNQWGRRCDFLDVCSGAVDPFESPLYQVQTKRSAQP